MAKIDRLVNVTIDLNTTAIAGKSFSDMLILGEHTLKNSARLLVVTDPNELLDLGLQSTNPLYIAVATAFSQPSHIAQVFIGRKGSDETVTDALAAIAKENNDWYGLAFASRDVEDVLLAAAWAEANGKLFVTASNDENLLQSSDQSDIASKLNEKQYYRSAVMYSHKADEEYPEIALMSYAFTFYPGAETWNLKKLAGVSYSPISEGEYIACAKKNATTFEKFNGSFAVTQGGKVAAGEWIDIIRFRDWLVQEVQINVTSVLINAYGKVPYTDKGIELIGAAIRQALDLGVARGGIAPVELDEDNKEIPSYIISLPRASSISNNNKAKRILQDVKFTARLAGAIHLVEIKGNLAYSL
ncbi:DUF3383 family protein [Gallibacterium salpingitidis]|uniref:DUF3383 family protein n=1 Tax=Gallibacterium salpingitidis TaxID=505341 RepID=A0A1A7NRX9_9PAST|nr:DUF3383 family protein [Gallibacterium salpingitidis]OBW92982.1 hypothetical protein QS62_07900 [Gallibacterium salpingitidis]